MEAGYTGTSWVELIPLEKRLQDFKGAIWVRRRAVPLTDAEKQALTGFAMAVQHRHFSLVRLAAQLTPFRSRGPIRTRFLGKPRGLRRGYLCSECVMESLIWIGLVDPATARPAATYPRDLFFDRSNIPYIDRHLKLAPAWAPPALWASCP
jgi:hypothetical protein